MYIVTAVQDHLKLISNWLQFNTCTIRPLFAACSQLSQNLHYTQKVVYSNYANVSLHGLCCGLCYDSHVQ